MSKLKNGLLGKTSGKVGGIVTGVWRGINYAREYAIPANPRSSAQTANRASFSALVAIGKQVKTTFIDTYWKGVATGKKFTGWSKYMGLNKTAIGDTLDLEDVKLANGSLESVKSVDPTFTASSDDIVVVWSADTVAGGDPDDVVKLSAWSQDRKFMYSESSALTRDDETGTIDVPNTTVGDKIFLYVDVYNSNGEYSTTQGFILTAI